MPHPEGPRCPAKLTMWPGSLQRTGTTRLSWSERPPSQWNGVGAGKKQGKDALELLLDKLRVPGPWAVRVKEEDGCIPSLVWVAEPCHSLTWGTLRSPTLH